MHIHGRSTGTAAPGLWLIPCRLCRCTTRLTLHIGMHFSPRRLVDKALNCLMQRPGQQVIVLSQVLVDDINTGYQQFQNLQVCVTPA